MAKPDAPPGQTKLVTVTNPSTGETKQVTNEEWAKGQMAKEGWKKVEPEPVAPEAG
jgi:hypothetical protein